MLTRQYLSSVFRGTLRVARLRADGIALFEDTAAGFWRSFWAAGLLTPLFLVTLWLEASHIEDGSAATRLVLLQTIAYVINWVAYPLLMVHVADLLQRWPNYYRYMVAYNWFRLVEAAAIYPLVLLAAAGIVNLDALAFFSLMALSAMLLYDWFIAKVALDVDGGTAAGLVLIAFLLSLVIRGVAERLA